jgi:hypothetical protein
MTLGVGMGAAVYRFTVIRDGESSVLDAKSPSHLSRRLWTWVAWDEAACRAAAEAVWRGRVVVDRAQGVVVLQGDYR